MIKFKYFFCIDILNIFILLFSNQLYATLPQDYQTYTAESKQEILWKQIVASNAQNPLPQMDSGRWRDVVRILKTLYSLNIIFDHASDEVPKEWSRFFHANAVVGKVFFNSKSNHPFTGIYKTGGEGIARLSLAVNPTIDSFTPGVAIKFLVDTRPSLNLFLMNCLAGQGESWNFFERDISNTISKPNSPMLNIVLKLFERTKSPATTMPVNQLAIWSKNGEQVSASISPEQLILKPGANVKDLIDPSSREDFRVSLAGLKLNSAILYNVYGILNNKEIYIGDIVLTSDLLASTYGDKELFFQHQR